MASERFYTEGDKDIKEYFAAGCPSSNGRKPDFDSGNRGSSPRGRAWRFKQWLCGVIGHPMEFVTDSKPGAEDAHYLCPRCGFTMDYYF